MKSMLIAASAALVLGLPAFAQEAAKPAALAPSEIVAAAPKADWVAIPAEDLLVMTLAPDAEGNPREVVIQLMPAPFAQGWVHNIRLFARAKWYDGISVNRVQDNYVTQWGDPNYDNPEASGTPKPLPHGLKVMGEDEYLVDNKPFWKNDYFLLKISDLSAKRAAEVIERSISKKQIGNEFSPVIFGCTYDVTSLPRNAYDLSREHLERGCNQIVYSDIEWFHDGWPLGGDDDYTWPVHCYGMVGVGRNYSPDTGSGAELYTVIGHAPRHLDRNIALVGRVIEGMEHLSSLPRGKGALGFYAANEAHKRTPILSVRVASDLPANEQPRFEYLSTDSVTFAAYAEAIANRRDPFFIAPAGGADICSIRVPVRRVAQ